MRLLLVFFAKLHLEINGADIQVTHNLSMMYRSMKEKHRRYEVLKSLMSDLISNSVRIIRNNWIYLHIAGGSKIDRAE